MNISKEYNEKELTLSLHDPIDTITSLDLENEITKEFGNFDSLIIDFADIDYISSAGLRVLLRTQKKLKKDNIPFIIRNVNKTTNKIFKISGFDKIFEIK